MPNDRTKRKSNAYPPETTVPALSWLKLLLLALALKIHDGGREKGKDISGLGRGYVGASFMLES